MATERLDVILELKTGNYKREAKEAATATGQIGDKAKTSSTQLGLLGQNTENASRKLKGLATGALLAVGAGLVTAIGKLDELGQKMESTERMAETVFGAMIDDARAWADQNNEAFGIGESAMLSLIAKTQDLLVPMGFVREEAFDMSQEILNVANALSEWEGGTITAEDAQLRLAKAMLGEREGLVELGVKITDAEVKAELARRGLDKLTGAAKQQAIAQVTLALVVGKSTDALTAYESRAGTATAAAKEQAATVDDTAESWAELLRGPIDGAKESLADLTDIVLFASEKTRDLQGASEDGAGGWTAYADSILDFVLPGSGELIEILGLAADATRTTAGLSGDAAEAARHMADAQKDDLIPAIVEAVPVIERLSTAQRLAGDATRHHFDALVSLANFLASRITPVIAARDALVNLSDAQTAARDAAFEHGRESEEFALAQVELALAVAEAEAAFGTFGVNAEDSIDAVATALGISNEAAQIYLETLGLLDGMTVTSTIILRQINLLEEGVIPEGQGWDRPNRGLPVGAFASGGIVPGPRGSQQLILAHGGETILPTHRTGSSTSNAFGGTVIVMSPSNNLPQDLQYGALLANHATFGKF